ncbi:benzoate 4-monooxygenase cytochrome-like protein P450 [Apiospora marii]|uniref:Benzoate 4-monooxygenase cytochrome-like protein P450 n=1 Tax=Apiospora marii TaxID=335849 RepID=A0ABR1R939_9PEZI
MDLHDTNSNTFKSPVYSAFKRFFGAEMSLTTVDHKIHAFRRRVNARAMTPVTVKTLEDRVTPHVDYLVGMIRGDINRSDESGGWSGGMDMSSVLAYCIADIMGDAIFSNFWDVQRNPQRRHLVHDLPKGVAGMHLVGHMQSLFVGNMHQVLFRELSDGVKQLMDLSRSLALQRHNNKEALGGDVWQHLLASRHPQTGEGFSIGELISEATLFVIGGTDGMITATTGTLFYLLHNPDKLDFLTREIRSAFPLASEDMGCPIRFASRELQRIAYLPACIDESMRLSPSVPSTLPRVAGPGGILVDGEHIPEGIDIAINHYSLHRDPKYFPDPLSYRPERWLTSDGTGSSIEGGADHQSMAAGAGQAPSFTPFGAGRSSCIGKHLAYQEMMYILARLIWQFDMRLDPHRRRVGEGTGEGCEGRDRADEFQLKDCMVSMQDGPVIQFRKRKDTGK